jgi:hypothetical protein
VTTYRNLPYDPIYDPKSLDCTTCKHCGSETREYAYHATKDMVLFLKLLDDHGQPARKKDLGSKLTRGMSSNGTQARLWGLIVSTNPNGRGPWRLTDRGNRFLDGRESIPKCVIVITGSDANKGNVVRYAGDMLSASQITTPGTDEMFENASDDKRTARRR